MTALPGWVPGTTVYQLHSLGAAGAPAEAGPAGDGLATLQRWLPHVEWLGCGAVLLTPIASSSTHGYDTVDPAVLDGRLGSDGAFERFVTDAHGRGLRVVLDGVFNHVGRRFPRFADVVARGRESPWSGWFRIDWDRFDATGGEEGAATFEGHHGLVALDHRNADVVDWAVDVARHWLDRGADGWRLDAAYAIDPAFVAAVADAVAVTNPDALLFGEVIHGDYGDYVAASHLHSVTQYELHKAVWSSLHDANCFELAWALQRHAAMARRFPPVVFAGNHDVTRLATATGDPSLSGAAMAVVATVPGIPCVYYGDELAWEGRKEQRAGGDDAVRQPLPVDGSPATGAAAGVLDATRQLVALRRERPWLTTAVLEVGDPANRSLSWTVTATTGTHSLHVAVDTDLTVPGLPAGWRPVAAGPGWAVGERPF